MYDALWPKTPLPATLTPATPVPSLTPTTATVFTFAPVSNLVDELAS
jgi:hypothetical protein